MFPSLPLLEKWYPKYMMDRNSKRQDSVKRLTLAT